MIMEKSFNVNELAAIVAKHLGVKSVTIDLIATHNELIPIGKGAICDMLVSLPVEQEKDDSDCSEDIVEMLNRRLNNTYILVPMTSQGGPELYIINTVGKEIISPKDAVLQVMERIVETYTGESGEQHTMLMADLKLIRDVLSG